MNKIFSVLSLLIVLMLNYSCSSSSDSDSDSGSNSTTDGLSQPAINTIDVTSITKNSAICGGIIYEDGGTAITSCGVIWSTLPNPTVDLNTKTNDNIVNKSFSSSITNLTDGLTYYVRAYAQNSRGIAYGRQVTFKAVTVLLPTVTTNSVSNISTSSALVGGVVTSNGGGVVSERGVVFGTSNNPTIENATRSIDVIGGEGSFNLAYSDVFLPHTTYYLRAYARNEKGISYGNEVSFTTQYPYVGANYRGGVIYYLLKPGDNGYISGEVHGLIVATENMYNSAHFSQQVSFGAGKISTSLGSGLANSIYIRSNDPHSYTAASDALSYKAGGFEDWYLPSKDELNLLYLNKSVLPPNNFFGTLWSSSLDDANRYAWIQNFYNGGLQSTTGVNTGSNGVRPIQSF